MVIQAPRLKFTTEQYHQMGESGILTPRDRVELIEGEIVQMSPIGRKHAACVDTLMELFVMTLSSKARVRAQNPIQLGDFSEPEPDFAILRKRADIYLEGHPKPQDILALVEVSDSTIDYDRAEKAPLYARAGIQELWIVDLNELTIEVYRVPAPDGYKDVRVLQKGQPLAFQAFPEAVFTTEQLLAGFL